MPARVRSLEILGDEKALGRLASTGLFSPGRLSWTLLRALRDQARVTGTRRQR